MTIKICLDFCKSKGTTYAGLEYHRECYCGNSIASDAIANDPGCTLTCKGNVSEICGGSNRMNLYQAVSGPEKEVSSTTTSSTSSSSSSTQTTSTTSTSSSSTSNSASSTTSGSLSSTTPSSAAASTISTTTSKSSTLTTSTRPSSSTSYVTPTPASTATATKGFYSLGCYAEPPAPTKKPWIQLLTNDTMSPDVCISALSSANAKLKPDVSTYAVFGLEYGNECWAATTLLQSQTTLVGDRACTLSCKGATDVSCGGRGMYNYYVPTAFEGSLTATSYPVRTSGTVRASSTARPV
ncbi:MAG: hypothetical protein Q9201_001492 [Fulgogasparrea decipioides]